MDDVIDDLLRVALRCERAAGSVEGEAVLQNSRKLMAAVDEVGKAWSGSWMGYQANVYTADLKPSQPGEFFDSEWGNMERFSNRSYGPWAEYNGEAIFAEVFRRAKLPQDYLKNESLQVGKVFEECKTEIIVTLEAALGVNEDKVLRESLDVVNKMKSHLSASSVVQGMMPKQFMSRDSRATQGGIMVPPHITVQARLTERTSYGTNICELGRRARRIAAYLEKARKMKGSTVAKKGGAVFIGHGGASGVWKDLRDFLERRLGVKVEEFNAKPVAGRSNKERLLELLDTCTFAFLVMTAEDETKDGKGIARRNVIHEIGLFQGRYGWERAIVLLEDGCEEFSNIEGVGQIRFPKGNIVAASEEIRRILEREGIL
jgi:predicted nucleotide-binding protein